METPNSTTNKDYYYVGAGGRETGPESLVDLRELWNEKQIHGGTLLWREGMVSWTAIDDLPTIKAKLRPPPPPANKTHGSHMPPLPPRPEDSFRHMAAAQSVKGFKLSPTPSGAGGLAKPGAKPKKGSPLEGAAAPALGQPQAINRVGSFVRAVVPKAGVWVEKRTVDNMAYYYHPETGAVSWDKPDSLKTGEELDGDNGRWVWVRDEVEGWLPSRVLDSNDHEVSVQTESGKRLRIPASPSQPFWSLKPSSLRLMEEDLVMLDDLNEAIMVHCLKDRYHRNDIYTWVGANHTVLISVNPFKQLPIYTIPIMHDFSRPSPNRLLPPHTFALANSAYLQLRMEGRNQAVLISGESGAGKTEATKQCLTYLAEVAGSDSAVEQRILNANPILESFGNSKTLRNNNSSRFGKWMEVHFDSRGSICGARMESYLLEKSRVVHQARGERNYHIFYQLFTSPLAAEFGLTGPEGFRYLRLSGCVQAAGIDDQQDHTEMKASLEELNFTDSEQRWMFSLAAGILHLGNVSFVTDGDQGSVVAPDGKASLQTAAKLLRINKDTLATALCTRSIEVRGELNRILQKPHEAIEAADALSKAVYNRLFDWIVCKINKSVQGRSGTFIGILDIFGFEIFEKNSFEQLCINYCNEKLQQHFNKNTFMEEEKVYREEGISFERVPFIDNQPVLDLIEKKPAGLLNLLDEEVRVPQGGDQKWLGKCDSHHASHSAWESSSGIARLAMEVAGFTVKHYAGNVRYDSTGFCEKNRDALSKDLYSLMAESTDHMNQTLFPIQDKSSTVRRIVHTLAGQFRKQLSTLMETVDKTQPHYIRCIKPNNAKVAKTFDANMCIEQLTYAGVFEAVKIRKCGFPFRYTHGRFASRYGCIAYKKATVPTAGRNKRAICEAILSSTSQDFSNVQIGNTMVLYRAEEHRILELLRNLALELILPVTQRAARLKIGRKYRAQLKRTKEVMKPALTLGNDIDVLEEALHKAAELLGPFKALFDFVPPEVSRGRDLHFKLTERRELTTVLTRLVKMDPEQHYLEFGSAIVRADAIKDIPGTAVQMEIEARCRVMLEHCAAARIDAPASDALWHLDRPKMMEVLDEATKVAYNSKDITEIREKLALPEPEFVKLQLKRANELNDPERIINREVALKDIYLTKFAHMFTLDKYPMLQDRVEWAYEKFLSLHKDMLAATFLLHTRTPIHAPLTRIPASLAKDATRQFKQIMGYMGDRKGQYIDMYAQDLLAKGLAEEELRGEFYVQLMKQLTRNESFESREQGWALMSLMLSCFPPPSTLENYLSVFLRTQAAPERRSQLLAQMYAIIYAGARRTPIQDYEIPVMVAEFYKRPISYRYTSEDIVRVRDHTRTASIDSATTSQAAQQRPGQERPVSAGGAGGASLVPAPQDHKTTTTSLPATDAGGVVPIVPPTPSALRIAPPTPAPALAMPAPELEAVVLYDYTPDGRDMLALVAGERIKVLEKTNDEWWLASKSGVQGWVPASYVQLPPRPQTSRNTASTRATSTRA